MSAACCTYTRPNGDPCAARPLPGSPFCLFHDPNHAEALAEARSKGGAAPRRVRRFPRVLDHLHVAELLSELFIDALNDPDAYDTKRLQALTRLAQLLLKAVGVPRDPPFLHASHAEPAASQDHLLRLYPPLTSDVEALLEAERPAAASHTGQPATAPAAPEAASSPAPPARLRPPDPSDRTDPSDPSDPPPITPDREQNPSACPPGHSVSEAAGDLPLKTRTSEHSCAEQASKQGGNRSSTGLPGTTETLAPPSLAPSNPDTGCPLPTVPALAAVPFPAASRAPIDPSLLAETRAVLAEVAPLLARKTAASLQQWIDHHQSPGSGP